MNRTPRRLPAAASLLAAVAIVLSCDDPAEPRVPVPGTMVVSITTPHGDDRALVLHLTGPDSITAVAGARPELVVYTRGDGLEVRAAVFGPVTSGALVRFDVKDVADVDSYAAQLVEVADSLNLLRASGDGYVLEVSR